jgi:hypothetical protein
MNINEFQVLLFASIIFWSAIFVYIIWIDRKISSLTKTLNVLKKKSKRSR